MIDWLTVRIGGLKLPAPIANGWTVKIDRDGQELLCVPHRLTAGGSFESSLTVRAVVLDELELSGNVSKFVQGHNLYGSDDPLEILWAALQRLEPVLGASLSEIGLDGPQALAQRALISRIDCTYMLRFESTGDVLSFLRGAEATGRVPRRGRGVLKANTLVFGHAAG